MRSENSDKLFQNLHEILNEGRKDLLIEDERLNDEIEFMILKVLKQTKNIEILLIEDSEFSSEFFSDLIKIATTNFKKSLKRLILKSLEKILLKIPLSSFLYTELIHFEKLEDLSLENNGLTHLPKM